MRQMEYGDSRSRSISDLEPSFFVEETSLEAVRRNFTGI